MRRREVIGLIAATAAGLQAHAQSGAKRWQIGLLASAPIAPIGRFKAKLKELGYPEGEHLSLEGRFSAGRDELYPALAADLLRLGVDVIVTWGTPAAFAAMRASSTVPIVMAAVGDVLSTGLVSNLARPGGNITGFSAVNAELEEKRLQLLKDLLPQLAHVGVLANTANPLNRVDIETIKRVAGVLNLLVSAVEVRQASEIEDALQLLAAAKPDAVLLGSDLLLLTQHEKIVAFMNFNRIPAIYPFREYAEAGGLIVHGADRALLSELAAGYVDLILRGAKPGDLPVQQATAFELVINLKTAAALGLTIHHLSSLVPTR